VRFGSQSPAAVAGPLLRRLRGLRARRLGRRGERAAVRGLRSAGYRVLARNVATPYGEVDVLAVEGEVLVVVEVKTTCAGTLCDPEARLSGAQRERLRRAARWLAGRSGAEGRLVRLDLVGVSFAGHRPVVRILRDSL